MKKLALVFLAMFVSVCAQGQTQSDFYGTWVGIEGTKTEQNITKHNSHNPYNDFPSWFYGKAT